MGLSLLLLIGSVIAFVLYTAYGLVRSNAKLREFKGPWIAKYTNGWMLWQSLHQNLYAAEKEVLRKYGTPARIGPNRLVTNDPDVVRHINAPMTKWTRSTWYDAMKLDPRQDNVFSTRDDRMHAELRSKETSGYSGRDAPATERSVDEGVVEFIELIDSYEGKSMDFAMVARWFSLDVLSNVAFSRKFGFMAAKADVWEYIKANDQFWGLLEIMANHTTIYKILSSPPVAALAAPKLTDSTGVGPALAFARKAVAERWNDKTLDGDDVLSSFKKRGLSQLQMEVEAHLQVVAGQDSTTTLIRSVLYTLVGTPVSYMKLRAEVDAAVASGKVSSPVITYEETKKLPYLCACMWEAIRMYPPLFGLKIKLAPPGGDTIKGIYYPEGTELGLCDEAIHRRADIFGPDVNLFRPERWLEADHETKSKYTRTVDLVFGAGKYVCLGKTIAFMQMHKALFELFRHYDWAMTDPFKGIDVVSQMVHQQSNMNLIATRRA